MNEEVCLETPMLFFGVLSLALTHRFRGADDCRASGDGSKNAQHHVFLNRQFTGYAVLVRRQFLVLPAGNITTGTHGTVNSSLWNHQL